MSWRSLIISNPARLHADNHQLIIEQEERVAIPLEDLGVIIIEEPQITITSYLLKCFADYNIAVFVCDEKHLPNGVFLSFGQHSRQRKVIEMQINLPKVFIKRCWQRIIMEKIGNQAECLRLSGRSGHEELLAIKSDVQSGDATNQEAYASKKYFNYLWKDFSRRNESVTNSALNYGYAILRGAVARSIVAYGFLPALGIYHCSELNNYNLADDFMEPFRPVVDLWVAENIIETDKTNELSKEQRAALVQLLHCDILIKEEKQTILNAIDIMISSFSSACKSGDYRLLNLPKLLPLVFHKYE